MEARHVLQVPRETTANPARAMIATVLFLIIALGAQAPSIQSQTEGITVGMITCETGALSAVGSRFLAVARAAVDQINAQGGLAPNGLQLRLEVRDDRSRAEHAELEALSLIHDEKVPAILGSCSSEATLAVSRETVPNAVILISSSSTAIPISTLDDSDLVFRTAPSDALSGTILAHAGRSQLDHRTASVIALDNVAGRGQASQFIKQFEILGGTITSRSPILFPPGTTEFTPFIRQARQGNPDVIVTLPGAGTAEPLIQQMNAMGVTNYNLFGGVLRVPEILNELASKVGKGALMGKIGAAPTNFPETTGFEAFEQLYQQVLPEDTSPSLFTPHTYDAVFTLALAIEKTLVSGHPVNGRSIRDQLRSVANVPGQVVTVGEWSEAKSLISRGEEVNYNGAGSVLEFDVNGDTPGPVGLWRVQERADGTLEGAMFRICNLGLVDNGNPKVKDCIDVS